MDWNLNVMNRDVEMDQLGALSGLKRERIWNVCNLLNTEMMTRWDNKRNLHERQSR